MIKNLKKLDNIKIIELLKNEVSNINEIEIENMINSNSYCKVYEEGNSILGFSILTFDNIKKDSTLVLYVSESNRNKGIGHKLYSNVIDFIKSKEIEKVNIEIRIEKYDTSSFFFKKGFKRWFGYCHMNYKGDNKNSSLNPVRYKDTYYNKYKELYENCFYDMRKSLNIQPYKVHPSRDELIKNQDYIFMLLDEDKIIGSVTLLNNEIEDLIVNKNYQNKGYGKELLNFGINHYISQESKDIYLRVANWNSKAINIYKNAGFRINVKGEYYYLDLNTKKPV